MYYTEADQETTFRTRTQILAENYEKCLQGDKLWLATEEEYLAWREFYSELREVPRVGAGA